MKYTKKQIASAICTALTAIAAAIAAVFGLSSCNVSRVISTTSSYVQSGDTTTNIEVKTVETYDARKHLSN